MMRSRKTLLVAACLAVGLFVLVNCSDKGGGPTGPGPFNAIKLDIYESDPLNDDYVFNLWAMGTNGTLSANAKTWSSLASFRTVPRGIELTAQLVTPGGANIANNTLVNLDVNWEDQDSIYITIEPVGSSLTEPEGPVFLRGGVPMDLDSSVLGGLSTVYEAPGQLSSFILATPTDDVQDNDTSGIWFVVPTTPPGASLHMMVSPAGWIYEGWAWHNGTWLSIGKFTDPAAPDESAKYSSTQNDPPDFPGEDFLANHPNLPWVFESGDSVKVTIEPDPDTDSLTAFSTTLLVTELDDNFHTAPVLIGMEYADEIQYVPAGTTVFKRSDDL